jgi:hypothetical protein
VSLEARIQALEDRHEVEGLLFRYAAGIRDGDPERVASCFSDDGRLELGIGRTAEGPEAIRTLIAANVSGGAFAQPPLSLDPRIVSTPVVGNIVVELDGDTARSTCVGVAIHGGVREGVEVVLLRGTVYSDELVRTADGWKIRSRKHTTHWQIEMPAAHPLRPV